MRAHKGGARLAGTIGSFAVLAAVLMAFGCKDLNVPNYTSADIELLGTRPGASAINRMSPGAQKEGVRGFVKTIMAYHYHTMVRVRCQHGGFIDVDRDRDGPLAPWVNGKTVLDHIV